jgi:hypothetical protein
MTIKSAAKRLLFKAAPSLATAWLSERARAHSHRLVKEWGLFEINARLIREVGPRVLTGPFMGLLLPPSTFSEHIGPFVLGTYEMELHPWWTEILGRRFSMIVDVGAKFGYYAIGLALKFPAAPTVAFDIDRWARRVMVDTAAANGVSNLTIKGHCSPEWLEAELAPGSFIISDCEGFEAELFASRPIASLQSATMLIELHDHVTPGTGRLIEGTFSRSHHIRRMQSRTSTPVQNVVTSLSSDELSRASSEVRSEQEWIYLVPR